MTKADCSLESSFVYLSTSGQLSSTEMWTLESTTEHQSTPVKMVFNVNTIYVELLDQCSCDVGSLKVWTCHLLILSTVA